MVAQRTASGGQSVAELEQQGVQLMSAANVPDRNWKPPADHTTFKQAPFAGKKHPKISKYKGKRQADNFTDSDSSDSEEHSSESEQGGDSDSKKDPKRVAANKQAFLSDEEIARHWMWSKVGYWMCLYPLTYWLCRVTSIGMEKLDPTKGALLVLMHSTHNADIAFMLNITYKSTGKVTRGLLHRDVMKMCPWFAYFGMVPGYRDTAVNLLKAGNWVGVIPGGGEEAVRGHESKYTVQWQAKRKGFAKVAQQAGVPIYPLFFQNQDEMKFNPLFYAWNRIGASKVWQSIVDLRIRWLSEAVNFFGQSVWFFLSFWGIPMPAKVTCVVGDPIFPEPDESPDVIRDRVVSELKRMIAIYQPNGIDRKRAFQMWLDDRRKRGATLPDYERQVEEDKIMAKLQQQNGHSDEDDVPPVVDGTHTNEPKKEL